MNQQRKIEEKIAEAKVTSELNARCCLDATLRANRAVESLETMLRVNGVEEDQIQSVLNYIETGKEIR